jgi:hypothetical protein
MLWARVLDALGTSRIGDMRELLLVHFEIAMGENGEEPNRAPGVSLDGRLRLLRDTVGPTLGAFGAFGVRGFEIE